MHQLPARAGQKPATTDRNPHTQLDQTAPTGLQEELWRRMHRLPEVRTGGSIVSVPGARALFLDSNASCNPDAFIRGREFAHIHPQSDGSLHLTLPLGLAREAIQKGWAEPHPLTKNGIVADTVVMIYGPRDDHELEIVWALSWPASTLPLMLAPTLRARSDHPASRRRVPFC